MLILLKEDLLNDFLNSQVKLIMVKLFMAGLRGIVMFASALLAQWPCT